MAETLKQKKIILAADIFPPESGGPATYVVNLAKELKKRGVDTRIVSLNPNSDTLAAPCPVYAVKRAPKFFRYLHYFFLLLKKGLAADVIYAMGPVNSGFPAYFASRILGKKFIVKVVGDYAWEQGVVRFGVKETIEDFQKREDYPVFVRVLRVVENFVVRRADTIITPSQYLKKIVLGWGAPEKKVRVVYNAVFEASDRQNLTEEAIPAKGAERWVVAVGRLVPWKGMATLIKISAGFPAGVKLKIIGNGPEYAKLLALIKELNVYHKAELLGELPRAKTLSYLRSADVVVLNSAYEGLSHVLAEASGLFGVWVLASNVGGNPEIVFPGKNGDLFEYDNAPEISEKIKTALTAPRPVLSDMDKQETTKRLSQFKMETMMSKTLEILLS